MRGSDITRLRERNGWTQKELADAINAALGRKYGSGSISPWETDKRPIPADVARFLEELTIATGLPSSADELEAPPLGVEPSQLGEAAADTSPFDPDAPAAPAGQPPLGGASTYTRACTELWEIIASGIGMAGAATGSHALMRDGEIIAADAPALGKAWGKLAEENATFRRMLMGMQEGGAWLQVALVTGTTVSKCYQGHAQYALAAAAQASTNGHSEHAAAADVL